MNLRRIGLVIQIGSILIALCIFMNNWLLGLALLIPIVFANILTQVTRKDINGITIKMLLLFQSILILFVITKQMTSNNDIDTLKDRIINNYNKNSYVHKAQSDNKKHTYHVDSINDATSKSNKATITTSIVQSSNKVADSNHKYTHDMKQHQLDITTEANALFHRLFDESMIPNDFPDLRYRSSSEVRESLPKLFKELPSDGFRNDLKNPCWNEHDDDESKDIACLPYAYILGQPKCGTSNLYEHLKKHPEVIMPRRKEVRWFTRGEFTLDFMQQEVDGEENRMNPHELRIGPASSIYSFTKAFETLITQIATSANDRLITIDGGPHTFWWPTQNSDGSLLPDDIPAPQIIRELQPDAKFIITLTDPVKRHYSDYYFLLDNLKPVKAGFETTKSADELHERAEIQINDFKFCLDKNMNKLTSESHKYKRIDKSPGSLLWLRASQICAHDRRKFGKGGWGRLSIGLYSLYLLKWLEHFSLSQFLVIRLEDYDDNPKEYMRTLFKFLDLSEPNESDWGMITFNNHINENKIHREPIREDTEKLLRDFYEPYNKLLSTILSDEKFLWAQRPGDLSLREEQLKEVETVKEPDLINENLSIEQRKMDAIKQRSIQRRQDYINNLAHERNHLGDANNQHGVGRFLNDSSHFDETVKRERDKIRFLRGKDGDVDTHFQKIFRPNQLDIEDLPRAQAFNSWFSDTPIISVDKNDIKNKEDAAQQLCSAAFGMDLYALEHLLYTIGIPSGITMDSDGGRNAFHCLSLVSHLADSHSKSHIFSVLKGKSSWLSDYINPVMEKKMQSVASYDIVSGLNEAVIKVAKWLLKAGVNQNLGDSFMNTPLHYASQGGMESLVEFLVSNGADPNSVNSEGRNPLHFAVAYGHTKVAARLIKAGADIDLSDNNGVTPNKIISSPGPVLKSEAEELLGITQRDPKKIERLLKPELHDLTERGYWAGGDGGWGLERMKGFEQDMGCDIDQYWADEITGKEIFQNYIAANTPVLIRGLISNWPAIQTYSYTNLTSRFGNIRVSVSDIPYAQKFGGSVSTDMLLSEYIEEVRDHKIIGEKHPWYVFRGHPIPVISDGPGSFVNFEDCPTPTTIYDAFRFVKGQSPTGVGGPSSRDNFINAQWAFGGEGTGAPVHFHNTAWNALVYGAKKWLVYPPHYKIMSSKQILDYFETDMDYFKKKGIQPLSCIQTAGDVMIIPESWGHGVLNLQESIAVATEAKFAVWRMKSPMKVMNSLPIDNREDLRDHKNNKIHH